MTLRNVLTLSFVAFVTIALSASGALVMLTTFLHRTATNLGAAMDNAQVAEEALVDLRAIDAFTARITLGGREDLVRVREARVASLRERLDELRERTSTADVTPLLEAAMRAVDRYLETTGIEAASPPKTPASRDTSAFDDARDALTRYVETHVGRAREERANAARWDAAATAFGMGAAVLLVLGTALVLVILRAHLVDPMMAIGAAISRYGAGERTRRAPELGPLELRTIARSFNAMAGRLERQREDQLELLAGVAHDLRNPLSAMQMASRTLAAECGDSPGIGPKLAIFDRQIQRVSRLASDFLEAARAEAGQLDLALEEHDLREVARTAFALFVASPSHTLELCVPEEPLLVCCDSGRLEQIAMNLVSNAIKYSPEGGRISVAVRAQGDVAVLSVSDEGVGISLDEIDVIFEPFRRGSRGANGVSGAGLGLAISRRIAERHGGSLTASSGPGPGATFELTVPLARPAVAQHAHRSGRSAAAK